MTILSIDKTLDERKADVLSYFNHRATEALSEIKLQYGESQYKKRAHSINQSLIEERERVLSQLRQIAQREEWTNAELLSKILLITHCSNVVMICSRNSVWPYEYMTFSRRIGELWEPFCNLCFDYPPRNDVSLFIPPLFDDVKKRLTSEIREFIQELPLAIVQRESLNRYYDQVWSLVTSGEIKLALDLHFKIADTRYVVDFKSGFSSNEKGNTNRLLLVASVFRNIEPEDYRCVILVRSEEFDNNHYLQTLKHSGLWEVYCGSEAYEQVHEYSGFDLKSWIAENISWAEDLDRESHEFFTTENLVRYLTW